MQISSKVAVAISLVVVLSGALASSISLGEVERERRADFTHTNTEALQLLALSVAPAVAARHHHRVQAVLDNIENFPESFPDIRELEVLDTEGRVVAALDPTRFNDVVTDDRLRRDLALEEPHVEQDGETLRIVFPLQLSRKLGVMRAELSVARLQASITRQKLNGMLLVLATMLLAGVALHFIHRRLVGERLVVLSRAAHALGEGDRDVVANNDGSDEIAELGESFNRMAAAIKLYTEDLEHLIEERTDELQQANKRLKQLATTDQLTGVWNRRYFDDGARRAIEVARRNERPLCIVLADTDHFKLVNDNFGHPVGDKVLKAVTQVLCENARKADLVARVGGEEFAILMPEVDIRSAARAAERMRAALQQDVSPSVTALKGHEVTASFGVAAFERAGDQLEDMLSAADRAMYRSKTDGRNRVTIADREDRSDASLDEPAPDESRDQAEWGGQG